MIQVLIACLAFVLIAAPARAQYRFQSWTADSGLPQNIVTGVRQTRDGYLWVATLDGVARFDGVRFTIFNKGNTPGISSHRFTSLYEDTRGDLWLGTETGTVTRYDGRRFVTHTTADGLPASLVRSFTGDAAGNVWLLSGDEIRQLDPGGGHFIEMAAPGQPGGYRHLLWSREGGFWRVDGLELLLVT